MSDRQSRLLGAPERRSLAIDDFELRSDVNEMVLEGYASVFESPYDILGGPAAGGWSEIVDRKAFDKTLAASPDVHLLINHEGMPLARTKSGTMDLTADKRGLKVVARLDRADPDVSRLATKMARGDMDEMSFAFRTIRHQWSEDETVRRLLEVSVHKGDVSVVNFGANPATKSSIRSLADAVDLLIAADNDVLSAELRTADQDRIAEAHRRLGVLLAAGRTATQRTRVALADPRSY